ncbi:MAG: hypothetical protein V3V08_26235 [Nannocystaceae bacterium]
MGETTVDDAGIRLNAPLSWLVGLAVFPILLVDKIETSHPVFTMAVITLITDLATRSFLELSTTAHSWSRFASRVGRESVVRGLPIVCMVVAMVFYAWLFSR